MASIRTRPEWAWADHDYVTKDLVDANTVLMEAASDFAQDFFTRDVQDIRKSHSQAELETSASTMVKELDNLITKLDTEVKLMLRMHRARLSA